ncbi:MAG: hypothetical protein K9H64_19455 [Bacteroidales bacterium]|nr:hypothetical protein [Bacteroidales bacterium]MCF8458231.1 hypothetical protein [Bacteroidales bacterium]
MKTKNYKRFEELEDKYFGKVGTPERDEYEIELKRELIRIETEDNLEFALKPRLSKIRYLIGLLSIVVGICTFIYFLDYYQTFIEQTSSPYKMWLFQVFPEDSVPQMILSVILIASGGLLIMKKKVSYYSYTLFFYGVILDSSYATFISDRIFEGIIYRFFLPVLISSVCLILLNLKKSIDLFEFAKIRSIKYLIIVFAIALLNTLNTRCFNTGFTINKEVHNNISP